jgi:protein disulfide-isomerase A1
VLDLGAGVRSETWSVGDKFDTCVLYLTSVREHDTLISRGIQQHRFCGCRRLLISTLHQFRIITMRTTRLLVSCLPAMAAANLIQWPSEFDFQEIIQKHDIVFVSFTSPRLDSIASLNQVFEQSATDLSTPFITIDCDIGISLCKKYDINSFPTMRLLERYPDREDKEMKTTRYRGPRSVQAIQSFIKKRELPILSEIKDSETDIRSIDSIVFVAYLLPTDTDLLTTYTAIAQKHHLDFVFAYTTNPAFTSDVGKVSAPSIVCYRNLDNDTLHLSGRFTTGDIENFLLAAKKSAIKDFREKDVEVFMQRDKLTVYIFTSSTSHKAIRHELTPTAQQYEKYVVFAIVDLARYPDMPANFGIENMKGGTAMVVHAPGNDQIFRYEQGKKIERGGVEDMLVTILEGRAVDGQIFGEDSEDLNDGEDQAEAEGGHDEL